MALEGRDQVNKQLQRLIRQPGGESGSIDPQGTVTCTVKYKCAWDYLLRLMPRRYVSKHPDFTGLTCSDVSFSKEPPGIAVITAKYTGVPAGDVTGPTGTGAFLPVEEISVATSQEPIETHPDWSTIGTTGNGAAFVSIDGKDVFSGWENGSAFEGIEAYLAAQATYRRSYVAESLPSLAGIGQIDTPTNAPAVTSGFTWLKVGVSASRQGEIFNVSEEWLLSANDDGWNTTIY